MAAQPNPLMLSNVAAAGMLKTKYKPMTHLVIVSEIPA
jgi:hypothetical protein